MSIFAVFAQIFVGSYFGKGIDSGDSIYTLAAKRVYMIAGEDYQRSWCRNFCQDQD